MKFFVLKYAKNLTEYCVKNANPAILTKNIHYIVVFVQFRAIYWEKAKTQLANASCKNFILRDLYKKPASDMSVFYI